MTDRRGGLPPFEAANGRVPGRCRGCGAVVPKGRVWWCGDSCVKEHRAATDPGYQRLLVFQRDRGVCSECRMDCVALRRDLMPLLELGPDRAVSALGVYHSNGGAFPEEVYAKFGADRAYAMERACDLVQEHGLLKQVGGGMAFWESDHRVPLWEGGTNETKNLVTLCVPCHRAKTKAGTARRASQRRQHGTG